MSKIDIDKIKEDGYDIITIFLEKMTDNISGAMDYLQLNYKVYHHLCVVYFDIIKDSDEFKEAIEYENSLKNSYTSMSINIYSNCSYVACRIFLNPTLIRYYASLEEECKQFDQFRIFLVNDISVDGTIGMYTFDVNRFSNAIYKYKLKEKLKTSGDYDMNTAINIVRGPHNV